MKCVVNGKEYTKEQMIHLEGIISGVIDAVKRAYEYIKGLFNKVLDGIKEFVQNVYWYVFISNYRNPLDNHNDNMMKYSLFYNSKRLIYQR